MHGDARLAYRIVVDEELGESHAAAFAGMKVELRDGTTTISGPVRDQAELQGLLSLVMVLHLKLLSLHVIEAPGTATGKTRAE